MIAIVRISSHFYKDKLPETYEKVMPITPTKVVEAFDLKPW